MIFSLAIVQDIYQDKSNRWRIVHTILTLTAEVPRLTFRSVGRQTRATGNPSTVLAPQCPTMIIYLPNHCSGKVTITVVPTPCSLSN